MDEYENKETHEEGVAVLLNSYHRYRMGFRGYRKQPLDYTEWLEHTAVRAIQNLSELADVNERLEEERDRYRHAADANHECWAEATRQNQSLYGLLGAVRSAAMRGDLSEVGRLLMVWACWN